MSSRRLRFMLPAALVLGLIGASIAIASGGDDGKSSSSATHFTASLNGHNEVPAVHSSGKGTLSLTINADNTMSFTLTYSNLNSAASMAHVHFGQKFAAGGVSFFFCGGAKPACPAGTGSTPVTVTGTVAAADVLGPAAQGINPGDIAAIVQEIRAGFTYANVHTATSPNGEIRGQLHATNNNDDDDDDDNGGDHHAKGKGKGHR